MKNFDVAIIGGGVIGASIAFELASGREASRWPYSIASSPGGKHPGRRRECYHRRQIPRAICPWCRSEERA